jgi:thioredoxin reductase (NADPH)
VGGGDTAAEEATYLANLAKKVYIIHRRDELRASKAMQKRVFNTKNIEVIWDHVVDEVLGEESAFSKKVTGARLKHAQTGETKEIAIDGFFLGIGHKPNTDIFKGQVNMDDNGYIKTKPDSTHTNIPGVFAAGDVKDPIYRQAVTSAGSGCEAAMDAERYLGELENQ